MVDHVGKNLRPNQVANSDLTAGKSGVKVFSILLFLLTEDKLTLSNKQYVSPKEIFWEVISAEFKWEFPKLIWAKIESLNYVICALLTFVPKSTYRYR